jgi:hypothetical protein
MSLSDAELLVAAIFKVPSATAKRMLAPAGDSPPGRDVPSGAEELRARSAAAEMTTLDDEISSAFALLGLLLVFVIGYFAALFPLAQDLLEQPAPEVKADRRALISRLRTYRVLVGGVLLLTVATGVVVTPLTRRVVLVISFRGPFPTIEAGAVPAPSSSSSSSSIWPSASNWTRVYMAVPAGPQVTGAALVIEDLPTISRGMLIPTTPQRGPGH